MKKHFIQVLCALIFFMLTSVLLWAAEPQETELEKRKQTLSYGLESEVTGLISTFIKEKDTFFADEVFTQFEQTKNTPVREKTIEYFTVLTDLRLKDFALDVLADPYDEKKSTVNLVFKYVAELKITEAAPLVVKLLETENEDYVEEGIKALGKIGGGEEAVFLTEYLEKPLSTGTKQALLRALGELKALETWDTLLKIAKDTNENVYMRMSAAEAIGSMKKEESIDELVRLFEDSDPNVRASVIKGLSNFSDSRSEKTIIQALKDDHYKVRLEAVRASKILQVKDSVPFLVYRAKNEKEALVKYECFDSLAAIGQKEGIDYLVSVVKDKKTNETARSKAAASLLQSAFDVSVDTVKEVARETLIDDKLKNLRYALGKEFAKYDNNALSDICLDFLGHKDIATKGTGLDMYRKGRYASVTARVQEIAANEKEGVNQKKAQMILERK